MSQEPENLTLVLEMNGEKGVLNHVADYPLDALILLDDDQNRVLTVREIRETYARHRRRRKRGR